MTRMSSRFVYYSICPECCRKITLTQDGKYRAHGHPARRCVGSGIDGDDVFYERVVRGSLAENTKGE